MKTLALFVVLTLGAAISYAGEKQAVANARAEFEVADAALNKAYKAVLTKLDRPHQDQLREAQRAWLKYRDSMAEDFPRFNGVKTDKPRQTPDYWQEMTGLSKERLTFLKVFSGRNVPKGIDGKYSDFYGGTLDLKETKDGIEFSIDVVRGKARNEGSNGGTVRREGNRAFFKEKVSRKEGRPPCEPVFTFIDGHIVDVGGTNTDSGNGFNAYLNGVYYKTGSLDKTK